MQPKFLKNFFKKIENKEREKKNKAIIDLLNSSNEPKLTNKIEEKINKYNEATGKILI